MRAISDQMKCFAGILITLALAVHAGVIHSPSMKLVSLGTESAAFSWKEEPFIEGGYDGDVFTLTGNGQGVYWCWDRCAAALLENPPLSGSFTFTARIKSMTLPSSGVAQIGILVKGYPLLRHPVLSLRWDTYWGDNRGTGLTWFNRITPVQMQELGHSYSEKLCHGTGQGCIGMGYESSIPGYASAEDLWLRVQRVVEGTSDKYYLYARYGESGEWREIPSITSTHNPCGSTQTPFEEPHELPNFMVPENNNGKVSVGLFVAHGSDAKERVTAEFDNITIEAQNSDEMHPAPLPNTFGPETVWWHAYMGPYANFNSKDCSYPLVDYLEDARQVWRSEEGLYGAKTGSGGGSSSSGGASPVVADGKVFLGYQNPEQRENEQAPDVVIALNAEDGTTEWKKVLDMTPHDASGKNFMYNRTVCVYDGKVIYPGGGGALYCLNAETGKRLWKVNTRQKCNASAAVVIDGVIVLGLGGGRAGLIADLGGYDISNGSEIWYIEGGIGGNATPTRWVHKGKEYVIAADASQKIVRCIEPKIGNVLWTENVGVNEYPIPVNEDYMIVNMGCRTTWTCEEADGDPYLACFKITPQGAEWVWDGPSNIDWGYTPVIYKDRVYHIGKDEKIVAFNIADGDIIAEHQINGGRMASKNVSNGRLILERDGGHSLNEMWYFDIESEPLKLLRKATWLPPHPNTSSYAIHMDKPLVDGRMFFRGQDALYCYDLRKNSEASALDKGNGIGVNAAASQSYRLIFAEAAMTVSATKALSGSPVHVSLYDHMGRRILSKIFSGATSNNEYRIAIKKNAIPRSGVVRITQKGGLTSSLRYVRPH